VGSPKFLSPPIENRHEKTLRGLGLPNKRFIVSILALSVYATFLHGVYAISILIALVIFTIILAVAWHYLAPTEWAWLSSKQLSAVRVFLFSGTITGLAGFLANYVRNRI
jgi:hypothetical protein